MEERLMATNCTLPFTHGLQKPLNFHSFSNSKDLEVFGINIVILARDKGGYTTNQFSEEIEKNLN